MMVALAGALRAYVESANAFIVCMFFIGAGMAVVGPNMPKALGSWFSQKEIALANGLCISGMGIGGAVAMATSASVMSPALGCWRNTMLVLGIAVFVVGILWMLIYKDPKQEGKIEREKPNMMENFKKAFKVKDLWLLSVFYGLNMVGMMALITFLPGVLEKRGMERAGELVSLMLIATVVFNILGGIISDRIGKRKPILIISSIIFGVGVLTLGALKGVSLIISLVITGAALGAIAPVLMTIPVEHKAIGPGLAATAMGVIFMVGNTGGAFGPVVAGKLMDFSGSHWAGFIFMALVLIAAGGCAVPMTETGRKRKPGEAPAAHGH